MTNQIIVSQASSLQAQAPTLASARDVLMYSLSSASKRQYAHTFKQWAKFAKDNGFHPSELSPQHIMMFLDASDLAHTTKKARLSHLRKLLETLHAQRPDDVQLESWYKQVKLFKLKRDENDAQTERQKHALKPREVHELLRVWSDDSPLHIRNRALLAVLFYAGLRRSEAAALEWRDIDLETGLIHVRHGKGDKSRTIPILSDTLTQYLGEWDAITDGRTYVFCALYKGGKFRKDKPVTTNAIYDVVRKTGKQIGVDALAPHDARRTLLTNALQAGANVADAQFIAGHANPQTTLDYAVVKDAKEVAGRVKLNY